MTLNTSRIRLIALAAVVAAGVAACGSSSSSTTTTSSTAAAGTTTGTTSAPASGGSGAIVGGTINGAGSTLAAPIYEQWGSDLMSKGLTVNFNPVGSGAGIAQLQSVTVNFAGSDPALKPADISGAKGPLFQFPVAFGAITLSYNLSGIKSGIDLDGAVIADIFLGKITKWNDPAITALGNNKSLNLPDTAITTVHRSDSSGTTNGFTTYLADVSPEWKSSIGSGKTVKWPNGTGAKGNSGVAAAVKQTSGSIGYVEQAYALSNNFTFAAVKNSSGTVHPAVDREHLGGGERSHRSGQSGDLDDQLPQCGGVSDRLADVPGLLRGHVQGRHQRVDRQVGQELLQLRLHDGADDARGRLQPAPVRAAAGFARAARIWRSWRSSPATERRSRKGV